MQRFFGIPWALLVLGLLLVVLPLPQLATASPSLILSGNESLKVTEGCSQWWHPADQRYCFYEATYRVKLVSAPSSGNVTVALQVRWWGQLRVEIGKDGDGICRAALTTTAQLPALSPQSSSRTEDGGLVQLSITPSVLTYTASTYGSYQTVNIKAVDDIVPSTSDTSSASITHLVSENGGSTEWVFVPVR